MESKAINQSPTQENIPSQKTGQSDCDMIWTYISNNIIMKENNKSIFLLLYKNKKKIVPN